ncbi:MAG: ribosomal-protein-alanine N-acetyltransferase [Chloroflexi bacterium]|nr:MAG: ribosomal-protein-alanine N-acetyltransferase [Chloroflexota bacterium]
MVWRDVSEVMAIERLSFPLPWPKHAYRYELEENDLSHYIVVRERARERAPERPMRWWHRFWPPRPATPVLGYGGFWMMAGEAHISTLAVHPDWRGRGLGELLLLTMLKQAIAMDAAIATLEVRASNRVAQALYRKYGFRMAGVRPRYYRDNKEDALIMTVEGLRTPAYRVHLEELEVALRERLARATPSPEAVAPG